MDSSPAAASGAMRQIHTKNVGYRIEQMKWSNRMDLLVVSNDRGEVIVHRLNLQKIWTHPPPTEEIRVRALDWCPDEKIVAVGYSSGHVALLDIELQLVVHSFELDADICCLSWTLNNREIHDDGDSSDNPLDQPDVYLPPLPSYNSLTSNAPKTDYNAANPYAKKVLNMLVVGLQTGVVHLSVFGVLPCGRIDVAEILQKTCGEVVLVDAKMCADFRQLQLVVVIGGATNANGSKVHLVTLDNAMLPNYLWPLLQLANKHGHILNTLAYIDDIIQCITEAWETALLEMDNKLTKYANSHPDGSVSADFLDLLLFGVPSESLEEFLTRDLTEKGLKKLGSSIEISYSTIQKLVIKPLHSGILNVCYHLSQIKGMSRNEYYYKPLLGPPNHTAIQNAGAFLIKSLELQQTIEQSTRDYKIFWCWLYGVVIRLMDEVVPDDMVAVSQQDTIYLAEFLNNFDADPSNESSGRRSHIDESSNVNMSGTASPLPAVPAVPPRKRFNLERVGQYLQNQPLQIPHALDLTQKWDQLLAENECLRDCEMIYPYEPTFSLVQQHNLLKDGIAALFSEPELLIGKRFGLESSTECVGRLANHPKQVRTSHVNDATERISLLAMLIDLRELIIVEICGNRRRAVKLEFGNRQDYADKLGGFGVLEFRDVQFYNAQTVSLLLANSTSSPDPAAFNCFVQLPIATARSRMTDCTQGAVSQLGSTNVYELLDAQLIRQLDGCDAATVSVSGTRKVSTILSESQKRIRVFEMEVDEDEEEEEDDDEDDDDLLDMSQQSSVGHDMSQDSTAN